MFVKTCATVSAEVEKNQSTVSRIVVSQYSLFQ